MNSSHVHEFNAIIRRLVRRIGEELDSALIETWLSKPAPLLQCVSDLKTMRVDSISINKAIKSVDILHSPWSFDDKGTFETRLVMCKAVYDMVEDQYAKHARTNYPADHIAKITAFLERNPEYRQDCVRQRPVSDKTVPFAALSACYWPHLKTQLLLMDIPRTNTWDTSGMECSISRESLLLQGTMGPDGRPRPHVRRTPHQSGQIAIVLPCGHIIGKECLDELRCSNQHATCPLCGGRLKYDCGHFYEDLPAPESPEDLLSFPFQYPPKKCDKCLWKDFTEFWDIGFRELLTDSERAIAALEGYAHTPQQDVARNSGPLLEYVDTVARMSCLLMFARQVADAGQDVEEIHSTWAAESPLEKLMALLHAS